MLKNSPSAISTFLVCQRKWAWSKIGKVPYTANKYAELGTRCHELFWDPYLRDGKLPDLSTQEGQIIQPTLIHLPLPKIASVEGWITLDGPHGPIVGRVDAHVHPDKRFPGEASLYGPLEGVPLAIDHKTSGNFAYALTSEELRSDPQALIYATWVILQYNTQTAVDVLWNYAHTRKPYSAHPVRARLPVVEIKDRMEDLLLVDNHMRSIYKNAKDPKEVEYTAASCSAFGGCPFESKCSLKSGERMASFMSQTLAERIAARKASQATPTPAKALELEVVEEAPPPPPKAAKAAKAAPPAVDETQVMIAKTLAALAESQSVLAKNQEVLVSLVEGLLA